MKSNTAAPSERTMPAATKNTDADAITIAPAMARMVGSEGSLSALLGRNHHVGLHDRNVCVPQLILNDLERPGCGKRVDARMVDR